jgi:hypothetical protein
MSPAIGTPGDYSPMSTLAGPFLRGNDGKYEDDRRDLHVAELIVHFGSGEDVVSVLRASGAGKGDEEAGFVVGGEG